MGMRWERGWWGAVKAVGSGFDRSVEIRLQQDDSGASITGPAGGETVLADGLGRVKPGYRDGFVERQDIGGCNHAERHDTAKRPSRTSRGTPLRPNPKGRQSRASDPPRPGARMP